MFAPKDKYIVAPKEFELRDFREYPDMFILRPPYQRYPRVWKSKMKEQFLDSLFRGYYIPKIVLREIRLAGDKIKYEVIDGQQRITTILEFFDDNSNLKLPSSLKDLDPELPTKKYKKLSPEKRAWIDKQISLKADIIKNIADKDNLEFLRIASELFFNLQQGEPLTKIESYHSKLGSNVRNFVSLYADDYSFDYDKYEPIEDNKHKHPFFKKILEMENDRMQHLLLLTRFLMVEFADGPTEVGKENFENFFLEKHPLKSKIERIDKEFMNLQEVKDCLSNLNILADIYKNNPMIDEQNGVKYLRKEYFVLSLYLLLRHLKRYYVFEKQQFKMFDEFSCKFYQRLIKKDESDQDIMVFRDNRQQSKENLETRDRIIRKIFFEDNKGMVLKDTKRTFDEFDKIEIYTRDRGICKLCYEQSLKEGLTSEEAEKKAKVSWSDYDADHIKPWISGGKSLPEAGQVLCHHHNRSKGSKK